MSIIQVPYSPSEIVAARKSGRFKLHPQFADAAFAGLGQFSNEFNYFHDSALDSHPGTMRTAIALTDGPSWVWDDTLQRWGTKHRGSKTDQTKQDRIDTTFMPFPIGYNRALTICYWYIQDTLDADGTNTISGNNYYAVTEIESGSYFGMLHQGSYVQAWTSSEASGTPRFLNVTGTPMHACLVRRGDSVLTNGLQIYKNGQPATNSAGGEVSSITTEAANFPNIAMYIGFQSENVPRYFPGQIFDYMFFYRALSDAEIAFLGDPANHPIVPLQQTWRVSRSSSGRLLRLRRALV